MPVRVGFIIGFCLVVACVAFSVLRHRPSSMGCSGHANTYHRIPGDDVEKKKKKKTGQIKKILKENTKREPAAPASTQNSENYDMSGRREAYIVCVKERRPGAEEDLQIMKKLLLDYKFTCHELVDPSAKGIIEGLREFRDELNGKKENVSCCFVIIMAHGRLGQIVGRDGEAVSLEAVFELFDNKQCSALREKPKVFIVQACRGESNFPGFNNADATKHGTPISEDRLPINSDTLSVYATIPGGAALRSKKRGSPMFNEMANIFPKYADKCHIYELFTKVNRRLNEVDFSEFYEKDTERVAVRREALALRNRKGLENRDSSGLTLHICSNLVKRVYLAP